MCRQAPAAAYEFILIAPSPPRGTIVLMRRPTSVTHTIALVSALSAGLNGCKSDDDKIGAATKQTPTCGPQQALCNAAPDANSSDPYCASTQTDNANCGSCSNVCGQGKVCSSGQCGTTCQPDEILCDADAADAGTPYCANTQMDISNCGACGTRCGQGTLCTGGQCINPCQSNETLCGATSNTDAGGASQCANLQADDANCGCCGNTCSPGQGCRNGRCDNTTRFTFFVFGDVHAGASASNTNMQIAVNQMNQIDSSAIAAFSNGDLVDSSVGGAFWTQHDTAIGASDFHSDTTCAASFGSLARYFATVGNHDILGGNWFNFWKQHLLAQQSLGVSSENGIYYTLTYANTLFVMLDSEHVSGVQTSWSDPQTTWLESVLTSTEAQSAQLKFLFLHEPVYACSYHPSFAAGLPWVDLAERNKVNVIFGSHTHVYTRTCPKTAGKCTTDGTGVVFVETGAVGGASRDIEVTTPTVVTGTDAAGNPRSDTYDCALGQSLVALDVLHNDFCHVTVDGCQATVSCYDVVDGNMTPFDTWTVNGC